MRHPARLLSIAALVAGLPAAGPAHAHASGCADIYPAMALGPFPEQTTAQLFFAAEGTPSGSFDVRWTGLACGRHTPVNAEYTDQPGTAAESSDYLMPDGQRTPSVCETGCAREASVAFPLVDDLTPEPAVETLTISLKNPQGGSLDLPSAAPFVIVDDDGITDRVGLDQLDYRLSETYPTLSVAVWRAGPASGAVQVPYTVAAGTADPATEGADYTVTSPNPLSFAPGDRVELVTLAVTNDSLGESDETVELSLGTPTGADQAETVKKTLTITDNEESSPPTSRLHHPRNRWSYSPDDYRLREVHVFTEDQGGSEVVRAELAVRANLAKGGCAWYTRKRFRPGPCERQRWLRMQELEPDFWYIRMRELPLSGEGYAESYTAFCRALDGAGNLERDLRRGRNANTFEVRTERERRGDRRSAARI